MSIGIDLMFLGCGDNDESIRAREITAFFRPRTEADAGKRYEGRKGFNKEDT